jgi:hypothetical protein
MLRYGCAGVLVIAALVMLFMVMVEWSNADPTGAFVALVKYFVLAIVAAAMISPLGPRGSG